MILKRKLHLKIAFKKKGEGEHTLPLKHVNPGRPRHLKAVEHTQGHRGACINAGILEWL